jgi:hypothetical protein
MTNHDRLASVFGNPTGRTFSNAEIVKLMLAESDIRPGSVLPDDHGEGNKGECRLGLLGRFSTGWDADVPRSTRTLSCDFVSTDWTTKEP